MKCVVKNLFEIYSPFLEAYEKHHVTKVLMDVYILVYTMLLHVIFGSVTCVLIIDKVVLYQYLYIKINGGQFGKCMCISQTMLTAGFLGYPRINKRYSLGAEDTTSTLYASWKFSWGFASGLSSQTNHESKPGSNFTSCGLAGR